MHALLLFNVFSIVVLVYAKDEILPDINTTNVNNGSSNSVTTSVDIESTKVPVLTVAAVNDGKDVPKKAVNSYTAQFSGRNRSELNWDMQKPCATDADANGPFRTMIGCRRFCRVGCSCRYNEFEEFYRCR